MPEIPQMTCATCRRSYPWKKNKRYCSEKCADEAAAARVSERSKELIQVPLVEWTKEFIMGLTPTVHAEVQKLTQGFPNTRVQILIIGHAPANSFGYRVGCMQPAGGGKYPRIRWFPSPVINPDPIFHLDPFEEPVVPIPCDYVVAYFNVERKLIAQPSIRVQIPNYRHSLPWSVGDRNLLLNPDTK